MGRRRRKNKHLPPKVQYKNGAHYFTPFIEGKLKYIWLGRSVNPDTMSEEATLAWRRLSMDNDVYANTMDYLFDHYMREVSPTKAKSTHKDNIYKIKNLRAVFGHMRPEAVKPSHIYKYQDMRSQDVLNINKLTDLRAEGIYVKQGKRKKKLLIKWNDALRESVYTLADYRKHLNCDYLFVARSGKKMTSDGFSTLWQKTITKALELKLIEKRFTFHDFKAKSVSDDESGHRSKRAGHSSEELTERVYDRRLKVVDALVRPTDILSVGQIEEVA